jgi:hypothetical protein
LGKVTKRAKRPLIIRGSLDHAQVGPLNRNKGFGGMAKALFSFWELEKVLESVFVNQADAVSQMVLIL